MDERRKFGVYAECAEGGGCESVCGKGNRDDSIRRSAGVIMRSSKHRKFTRSMGNENQTEDWTCWLQIGIAEG